MRRSGLILLLLVAVLITSCSSTKAFTSSELLSVETPVEEKLSSIGAVSVSVPFPEVYFDGTEWLHRLTELFEEAEDYILVSTFLGSDSPALEDMYGALMDAAERGVRVYFLMDGISSFDMTESKKYMTPLYFLRQSGIHLAEYNPLTVTHLFNPATIVLRDHEKLVVVDGDKAAIGGMNMNYISLGAGEGETQRDSMYLFDSPSLAAALKDEFVMLWNEVSVDKIASDEFHVRPDDGGEYPAYLVSTDGIAAMYASLIGSARENIIILPYLPALDNNMKSALRTARERGVYIRMIMPVDLRGYAASGIYQELPNLMKATGCDVFLSIADESGQVLPLLHEKLMIVDSRYVVIGSSNFNFRSMSLSEELALVVDSPELAALLEKHADEIAEISHNISIEEAEKLREEEGSSLAYLFMLFGG